jgi:hypothetical protein
MRLLLLLIVLAGAGGYFTRPDADAHWKTVAGLIEQGATDGGAISDRSGKFSDYYVATNYVFSVGGEPRLECWGAFTRFLCIRPDAG